MIASNFTLPITNLQQQSRLSSQKSLSTSNYPDMKNRILFSGFFAGLLPQLSNAYFVQQSIEESEQKKRKTLEAENTNLKAENNTLKLQLQQYQPTQLPAQRYICPYKGYGTPPSAFGYSMNPSVV